MRDNFKLKTKNLLAERVAYKCSNPNCSIITIGPNVNKLKSTKIGVAAHITAAAKNGPRYNHNLTSEKRKGFDNGIWLCENCASEIDKNPYKYSVEILEGWKQLAEKNAELSISKSNSNKKYLFEGVQYLSKLELSWAIFFRKIGWHSTYLPYEDEQWTPSFKITTTGGTDFFVDVGLKSKFNSEKRLRIGLATNFSKGILAVFETAFNVGQKWNNVIGLTSLEGEIENEQGESDFEFCTSVIADLYGNNDILNLCKDHFDPQDKLESNPDYYYLIWQDAKNLTNAY